MVVRVVSGEVVDVKCDVGVVHEALKELYHQINIKLHDFCAGKGHMKFEPRTTAAVDHHPR